MVVYTFHINDSFNTQPPEGGWATTSTSNAMINSFNTQPPEGGWLDAARRQKVEVVSTHSRLKAAGSTRPAVKK